jgi:hypothetical protein
LVTKRKGNSIGVNIDRLGGHLLKWDKSDTETQYCMISHICEIQKCFS